MSCAGHFSGGRRWLVLLAAVLLWSAMTAASASAAGDRMLTGDTLSSGQALSSPDGHYRLVMQSDGNLVLYLVNGTSGLIALWSTGTSGDQGAHAVLQSNGNVVVDDSNNQPVWSSNTSNAGCANLVVQNDGNLVLYNSARAIWSTNTVHNSLRPGEQLTQGESIYSLGEEYVLIMQDDNNLVLYGPQGALWATATNGHPGAYAIMQGDGNLVVYTPAGQELWASNTGGHPGAYAAVQDDGNFVVYQGSTALWNSVTEGNRTGPAAFQRPAFTACPAAPPPPPPPAPVVVVPTNTPVPTLRRLKVKMTITWTWNRGVTHLHHITIAHLPRRATVTVSCAGRGCSRHRARAGRRRLGRLIRSLDGRAFHAGDRVVIAISERGYTAERVAIRIRYGALPRVRLL